MSSKSSELTNISGYTSRGEMVKTVQIESSTGMKAAIVTLGARLLDLRLWDGTPVLLQHTKVEHFNEDKTYINATIGRVANRIKKGRMTAHESLADIQLPLNDNGKNTLHGGSLSWDRRLFSITSKTNSAVELQMLSPDGDNGFPSVVVVDVRFEFTSGDEITVTMTSKNIGHTETPTNMTLHSYFDLTGNAGTKKNAALHHSMHSPNCGKYVAVDDEELIPTGELTDVSGTRFDFRDSRLVNDQDDESKFEGYDHYFVTNTSEDRSDEVEPQLTLIGPKDEDSGKTTKMVVSSNQPGFQMYTGGGFDGSTEQGFAKFGCFAIEPSEFIDSVNNKNFPCIVLQPSESRRQIMSFKFSQE